MTSKLFNTKKITGMAILSALAIALLYIPGLKFPIFAIAPFLEYDACDIPIMFATFIYGPLSGLIVTFIVSIIQGVTISSVSGFYGILMHIIATGSFSLSAGFLFAFLKNKNINQIIALAISTITGSLCWLVVMIFANMAITPLFMKVPFSELMKIMLPAIIPFNLIKASVNGTIGAILYIPLHKSVSKYLDKQIATSEDIAKTEMVTCCEGAKEITRQKEISQNENVCCDTPKENTIKDELADKETATNLSNDIYKE